MYFVNNKPINEESSNLHIAVSYGNESVIRSLLLKGADPNAEDSLSYEPLYYALLRNDEKIVETLLEFGAKANQVFECFYTKMSYLQKACEGNKTEIIKLLLDYGCDVNASFQSINGSTPLHLAVANKNLDTVKLLLNYDADVNVTNDEGEVPLHIACETGDSEIVKLLLEKNALVNVKTKNYLTPFYKSVKSENYKIIEILIENGVSLENENSETIIYFYILLEKAIVKGNNKIISDFLQVGLDPNKKYYSPKNNICKTLLHSAVLNHQSLIINILLEYKADVTIKDDYGKLPLHIAAESENPMIMKKLLDFEGKNSCTVLAVDKEYSTPLHAACKTKNTECIKMLVNHKADLCAQTINGDTPLHMACEFSNVEAIQILLDNGSPLDQVNFDGNTPLHVATNNKNVEIVELLLHRGAKTIVKNKENKIPLFTALCQNSKKCIDLLIEYSDDVNHEFHQEIFYDILKCPFKNDLYHVEIFFLNGFIVNPKENDGIKNIYCALVNNKVDLVQELLYKGVDVDVIIGGQTLLHLACILNYSSIVRVLLNHKANVHVKNLDKKLSIYYAYVNNSKIIIEMILDSLDLQSYPEIFHYPICTLKFRYSKDYHKMLEELILRGINVNYCNKKGFNALHLVLDCINNGWKKFDPDSKGRTLLLKKMTVAKYLTRFFLKHGVNVNAKTYDSNEGVIHKLLKMCVNDHKDADMYSILLDDLIECPELYLDSENNKGETALQIAVCKKSFVYGHKLVKFGANINDKTLEKVGLLLMSSLTLTDDIFDYDRGKVENIEYFCEAVRNEILLDEKIRLSTSKAANLDNVYEKELNCIGDIKISGNNINLRCILEQSTKNLARLVRNEDTADAMMRMMIRDKEFFFYGKMVFRRYSQAIWRKNLIDTAHCKLRSLINVNLPILCAEIIFDYMTDLELEQLCKSVTNNGGDDYSMKFTNEMLEFLKIAEEKYQLKLEFLWQLFFFDFRLLRSSIKLEQLPEYKFLNNVDDDF